jgi:HSP20 family protein
MNLVLRREPLSLLDDMYETFANRVGYAMPAPAWGSPAAAWGSPGATRARLDVVEKGDVYEIKVDLPGVKKGDIQIDLNDNHVAISAAARTDREVKDGEVAIYSERQTSQFARSFDLPQPVMEDKADASFEDGVLTLKLPKKKTHTGRRLAIR